MTSAATTTETDEEEKPATTEPAGSRRVLLALMLGGLTAFAPLSLDMYLPTLPSIASDLSSTASQVQLTLTGCLVGIALGQLLVGPLSDTWGRRRPLLIGLTVYIGASLACAFAPTVTLLIGFRVVQGLAGATGVVIARAVVRDLFSGVAVARFFSSLMLVTGLAPICAPLLGGALLRVTSWRGVFVVLFVMGLLLLLMAVTGLPETLPPRRRAASGLAPTLRTLRVLATDRSFVGYALPVGLAFGAVFAYLSGSPFVIQNIYGASPQLYSVFFGINALGLVTVTQVNARLVGRFPPRRLLATGLGTNALGGLGVFLVTVTHSFGLPGLLVTLFVTVASLGLVMPNATALALSRSAHTAGSASAILGTLQFLVGAVTAPLVGVAGKATALPMATVIVLLTGMAVLTFTVLTRGAAGTDGAVTAVDA